MRESKRYLVVGYIFTDNPEMNAVGEYIEYHVADCGYNAASVARNKVIEKYEENHLHVIGVYEDNNNYLFNKRDSH